MGDHEATLVDRQMDAEVRGQLAAAAAGVSGPARRIERTSSFF